MALVRLHLFLSLLLCGLATGALLVDYKVTRGDDPSKMGQLNLEARRNDKQNKNSAELYIKSDMDWKGTKCAHFHRKKDYIR